MYTILILNLRTKELSIGPSFTDHTRTLQYCETLNRTATNQQFLHASSEKAHNYTFAVYINVIAIEEKAKEVSA